MQLSDEQQTELVESVRELFTLLTHTPEDHLFHWCFNSLSRDSRKFDKIMDRIAAALPQE